MSSENVNRHKVSTVKVGDYDLEVLTLGNGSQVNLIKYPKYLPGTFWIDLQFEVESILGVRIFSMSLRPREIPSDNETILHIIHEPNNTNYALLHDKAASIPEDKKSQIDTLHKMHKMCVND